MKILVLSDSHNMLADAEKAIEKHGCEYIIFLGDVAEDAETLRKFYPRKAIAAVKGNNDYFSDLPEKITPVYEGHKVYCCHGHTHRVKSGLTSLYYAAKSENCDVTLFGHTHIQFAEEHDGILFLNPGSVGFKGNYAILSLEKNKKPEYLLF